MKEFEITAKFVVHAKERKDAREWIEENIHNSFTRDIGDGDVMFKTSRVKQVKPVVTKRSIYNEICRTLTDYEQQEDTITGPVDAEEFYSLLVKIQNNWEDVITAED